MAKTQIVAGARMIVTGEGDFDQTALTPFDRLITPPHKLLVGRVVSIHRTSDKNQSGGSIVLEDGGIVSFAILVIASGSIWPKKHPLA